MTKTTAAPPRAAMPARRLPRLSPAVLASAIVLAPAIAAACACGCGIFDVGGASGIMPSYQEGDYSLYFRYDYMNQDTNWRGDNKAAAALNDDKGLNSSFYTTGAQWRVNPDWTLMAELPVFARHLTTTDDDGTVFGPAGAVYTGKTVSVGDAQIMGVYTGLTPDGTTGILAGVKLPTGDFHGPRGPLGGYEFDRDSLPGTGSTDIILGAYHTGTFTDSLPLGYYVQTRAEFAVLTQSVADNGGDYRPGDEFDSAAGVDYTFSNVKPFTSVSPVFSLLTSYRMHDQFEAADFENSGYFRLLAAPGVQLQFRNVRLYADVEVPLYQHVNSAPLPEYPSGQLVASPLYKIQLNYDF